MLYSTTDSRTVDESCYNRHWLYISMPLSVDSSRKSLCSILGSVYITQFCKLRPKIVVSGNMAKNRVGRSDFF